MRVKINASPSNRATYPGYTHGLEGETTGEVYNSGNPEGQGPHVVVSLDSGSVIHYPPHMIQPISSKQETEI